MKRTPQGRYSRELGEEAVKLSLPEVACRLSMPPSTLGNWIRAYKAGRLEEAGKNYLPLTEVEMELARVKKENAELKMEPDILKKALLCQGVAARYAMMKELRLTYPVFLLSRLMGVSASGYYWYGSERLQRDLPEHGVRVGICRIRHGQVI